jgi:hypothetical protein
MSSQTGARLVYANAKNTLMRHNINPAKAVLSQSFLRFEANLSATTTQYTMDVLVNDNLNPNFVTQTKLNLQDSFICSSIGIFVGVPQGPAVSEGKVDLFSYPDPSVFTAGSNTALMALYNGFLSLTVNQRVIVPSWDIYRHYKAPIIQNGFTPSGTAATGVENSNDWATDGFFTVEPNMVFVGSKKNELKITLPQAIPTVLANSRLVVICRGLLAQNSTPVR